MSRRTLLRLQIVLWTTYAVVRFAAVLPAVQPDERVTLAFMQVVRAGTGFGVTCAFAWLLNRQWRSADKLPWLAAALGVPIAAAVWMIADRTLLVALVPLGGGEVPWQSVPRGLELEYFFVILAWAGGAFSRIQAARERQLREALLQQQLSTKAAQLDLLLAQLNPHFVFNTLNMIRSLIVDDPALAREMLTRLSSLLRRVLDIQSTARIRLDAEFELLADYLHIQKARFEDTLQLEFNLPESLGKMLVPPLILQPLVENAIKHGVPNEAGLRCIAVRAERSNGTLNIEVQNSGRLGAGLAEGGLGLQLTRRRLHAIYAGAAAVELEADNGIVTARIRIDDGA